MITRKSPRALEAMRAAGRVLSAAMRAVEKKVAPGVTTAELDRVGEDLIRSRHGEALFKGYRVGQLEFPATICTSVNDEVVHGIPGDRALEEGDILSVDCGVRLRGYCADAAVTLAVGSIDEEAQRLIDVCKEALRAGIGAVRERAALSAVSRAVQQCAESQGCSVVREYTGHGIGRSMHEDPKVPNFVSDEVPEVVLRKGMTICIEPMVNLGGPEVRVLDNGWTVVTADGSLSAHWEHTVAVAPDGADILTLP